MDDNTYNTIQPLQERFWNTDYQRKSGRPRLFNSDVDMYHKIVAYIEANHATARFQKNKRGIEELTKEPMIWTELLHSIGLSKQSARPYLHGQYDENGNDFSSLLSWAREVVEADTQKGGLKGTYDSRFAQAVLQAKFGWSIENKLSITQEVTYTPDEATKVLMNMINEVKGFIDVES